MPFLRFSRDKRGYENTYLMHAVTRRGKPARTRILYWYRTPPGVRVGRLPFDEEMRRTIEAKNPGIIFDWKALASTPLPAVEPEPWRERRRAERAAKLARRLEEAENGDSDEGNGDGDAVDAERRSEPPPDVAAAAGDSESWAPATEAVDAVSASEGGNERLAGAQGTEDAVVRKRRRRGGRRRRTGAGPIEGAPDASGEATQSVPSESTDSSSEEE